MDQKAIWGAWRLESHQRCNGRGEVQEIPNWEGQLVYTDDGYMSAVLSGASRPGFALNDPRAGTPGETKAAFDSYLSYCGRYTLQDDHIIHHVEMSLFPNWKGADQRRFVSMTDGKLVLSTPPMLVEGEEWTYELHWVRPTS